MSFLVAGATGAVGHCVVQNALSSAFADDVRGVVALTRQTVSAENPVEKIFRFSEVKDTSSSFEMDKLSVVTFDWDRFLVFWKKFSQISLEEQRLMETPSAWSFSTISKEDQKGDSKSGILKGSYADSSVSASIAETSLTAIESLHELEFESEITPSFRELKEEYDYYKKVFSSHEYAAICLGISRREAKNTDAFVCCNFSYALAFTEALLCFSAPAGWNLLAEGILPPLLSKNHKKKFFNEEQQQHHDESCSSNGSESTPAILCRSPTWLQFRISPPTSPTSKESISQCPNVLLDVLAYYSQEHVQRNVVTLQCSRSSQSLKGITLISCYGASAHSKIPFQQVKGALECAISERILLHNKLLEKQLSEHPATLSTATLRTSSLAPLHFNVLRPGILNRESKPRKEFKILDSIALHTGLKVHVVGTAVLKNYRWCQSFSNCPLAEILERYPAARRYPHKETFERVCEPFFWFNHNGIRTFSKTTPFDPFISEQL